MKFLYKWLGKKINHAVNDELVLERDSKLEVEQPQPRRFNKSGLNFQVFPADSGGYVVEYTSHDHRIGKSECRLHIIDDRDSLAEKLSHIITIETLRA